MKNTAERLLASLEARDDLSPDERNALTSAPWRIQTYEAEEEIVSSGSRPDESCSLIEGLAGRSIAFLDGRRQIAALQVPGDFVDLHSLLLRVMDHDVIALSQTKVAFLHHDYLRMLSEKQPHLWRVFSTLVAVDAAIQRHYAASLGRRPASVRLAHLICELFVRLRIVGLVSDSSFSFPITLMVLADLQGLSVVHVNRTLQSLRSTGLVVWAKDKVTIGDWDKLAGFAEFDPTYLSDVKMPR